MDQSAKGSRHAGLRRAFGCFSTGVTVLTARTPRGVHGMTANAFMSVSLDPPMVAVGLQETSRMRHLLAETGKRFGVSVLTAEQVAVADRFAGRRSPSAPPRWRLVDEDLALVEDCLAWFICRTHQVVPAGDHELLVATVDAFSGPETEAGPLTFYAGRYYRRLEETRAVDYDWFY